jgi:hypothetical protein
VIRAAEDSNNFIGAYDLSIVCDMEIRRITGIITGAEGLGKASLVLYVPEQHLTLQC